MWCASGLKCLGSFSCFVVVLYWECLKVTRTASMPTSFSPEDGLAVLDDEVEKDSDKKSTPALSISAETEYDPEGS